MRLTVFQIPYDTGRYGERMGRGPLHLVERGLVQDLEADGHDVELRPLRLPAEFATEAGAASQIHRLLAAGAAEAREAGRLPVVLAGNCNATLGALAAQPPGSTGLVWLDAHADFNTPETSTSGFLDGMSLAMITGAAWQALAAAVPGFHPLPERDVILVGARDLDPAEAGRLAHSRITCVAAAGVPDTVEAALDHLARRVRRVHLHIDLDVLDPSEGSANAFAVPGGLALMQTEMLVAAVAQRFAVAGVTLSAYDPACDPDGRIARAAGALLHALLEALAP